VQIAADEDAQCFGRREGVEAGWAGVGDFASAVRAEAQGAGLAGPVQDLAPARPQVLEGGHHPLTGPRAGAGDDLLVQFGDGQRRPVQGVGDRRDHLGGPVVGEPDVRGEPAHRRDRGQRGAPQRQFARGQ
jgi:hypothetical protein